MSLNEQNDYLEQKLNYKFIKNSENKIFHYVKVIGKCAILLDMELVGIKLYFKKISVVNVEISTVAEAYDMLYIFNLAQQDKREVKSICN